MLFLPQMHLMTRYGMGGFRVGEEMAWGFLKNNFRLLLVLLYDSRKNPLLRLFLEVDGDGDMRYQSNMSF